MKRAVLILAASLAASSAQGYSGEKMTLDAPCIEVRQVLQIIADLTGLNVITSDTVGGTLTLRLKDVPWDQALDIVLEAKGLAKRVNGNVVLIAPARELESKPSLGWDPLPTERLHTRAFALSNTSADEVRRLLSSSGRGLLSRRGAASIDARTNTLFVQDVEEVLEEVARLVRRLDAAPYLPI